MNPIDRTNQTGMQKDRQKQGFTIMEMLIVVAIIAILVAVSIPIFNNSLHKAKVAADKANLRAYYAELQLEYMTSGEYDTNIPTSKEFSGKGIKTLTFADGTMPTMQAGVYEVFRPSDADIKEGTTGYTLVYQCDKGDGCAFVIDEINSRDLICVNKAAMVDICV